MALTSPYTVIVPAVRAEIGDNVPLADQEFTDDDIVAQVNQAMLHQVYIDIGNRYKVTDNQLDPAILDESIFVQAAIYATAERLVTHRYQSASSQNIEIDKGNTRINTKELVSGLLKAKTDIRQKYNSMLMRACEGIVQIPATE